MWRDVSFDSSSILQDGTESIELLIILVVHEEEIDTLIRGINGVAKVMEKLERFVIALVA